MDTDTAEAAVSAGSDAIGLIFFALSKRHLELDQAASICRSAGPFVSTVAVMVNPDPQYVEAIISQVSPSHLQFHGEETAEFCASFGKPYIKALRMAQGIDLLKMESCYDSAQGILLDTHVPDIVGGTGAVFDWGRANYGGSKPVILAGGLSSDNIVEAIDQVCPYAVDISSGVESNGRKDPEKIRRICRRIINSE